MFTTLEKPRLELGLTLQMAIRLQKQRLKEWERSGARMSEWDGPILEDGKPVYDVSQNGRVFRLQPLTDAQYNALSKDDQIINCRAVWFDKYKMKTCRMFRQHETDL